MTKKITVIPAKKVLKIDPAEGVIRRKRVAAYARVSTEKDEQTNSYQAQVDYYTNHIKGNPEWEFAGVYSDEGITGTSIKKREGFNRMINDALDGKIDLILTKSVSRFARNTVDSLTTVRKLKDKGVEIFFEKENIYTLDSKGELLLTILSSLSQEESRNISSNVAWGLRKRFADGKVMFAYSNMLGFKKGENGGIEIVEEEAKIAVKIYELYLAGYSINSICNYLQEHNIKSPMGKDKWQFAVVKSVLTNEKYVGDAVLQKKFTVDFLTKKKKVNEGEIPQYYVHNSHEAIISREMFNAVQEELQRRNEIGSTIKVSPLSNRIVCGDCGGAYGRKVWHANQKYECFVWHCNNKFFKRKYCETPTLKEEAIKQCFVDLFNSVILRRDEIIKNYEACIDIITDDSELVKRKTELETELEKEGKDIKTFVLRCAKSPDKIDEVNAEYDKYIKSYEVLQKELIEVMDKITKCSTRRIQINTFIELLKNKGEYLTEFDENIWQMAVHHVEVFSDNKVKFILRDGAAYETVIESGVKKVAKKSRKDSNSQTE